MIIVIGVTITGSKLINVYITAVQIVIIFPVGMVLVLLLISAISLLFFIVKQTRTNTREPSVHSEQKQTQSSQV